MKRTTLFFVIFIAVVLLGFSLWQNAKVLLAETENTQQQAASGAVMGKLEEIIKNQQIILQKLDDIKQELEIVKIRATKK